MLSIKLTLVTLFGYFFVLSYAEVSDKIEAVSLEYEESLENTNDGIQTVSFAFLKET